MLMNDHSSNGMSITLCQVSFVLQFLQEFEPKIVPVASPVRPQEFPRPVFPSPDLVRMVTRMETPEQTLRKTSK